RDEGFEHVSRYVTGLILSPNKTLQGIYDLQVLFFLLTRRSPRGGSGCQGCAAERSTTGATEERKEPGLDAGASAAYIALLSSRKNRSGEPQARGAASELRPPARPPRPWEAYHGVPIRAAHS